MALMETVQVRWLLRLYLSLISQGTPANAETPQPQTLNSKSRTIYIHLHICIYIYTCNMYILHVYLQKIYICIYMIIYIYIFILVYMYICTSTLMAEDPKPRMMPESGQQAKLRSRGAHLRIWHHAGAPVFCQCGLKQPLRPRRLQHMEYLRTLMRVSQRQHGSRSYARKPMSV